MSERVALTADNLKTVKKALRCPAKLIKSDAEKQFFRETKERLEKFGDALYLSEKQLSWLEKIAGRIEPRPASSSAATSVTSGEMPSYEEMGGE